MHNSLHNLHVARSCLIWSAFPFTPTGPKTLYDNWGEAVERYGPLPCLGRRSGTAYSYITFAEAGRLVADVASAMAHACNHNTVYCVPLYDVLGDNTVEYIIEHSESSIVFVAADKLPVLAKALTKVNLPRVETIVYWGEPSGLALQALQTIQGLSSLSGVHSFQDFAALGREHPAPPGKLCCCCCCYPRAPPKAEDICTIMYTSGTTGTPKARAGVGVLLTHRAVASEVQSLGSWMAARGFGPDDPNDVYLSFLPLAHIYGRCVEEGFLTSGKAVAYWSGEAKGIPADIRASQPTIFCSVPRVLERFEITVMDKASAAAVGGLRAQLSWHPVAAWAVKKDTPFKQWLFHTAFKLKLAALKAGSPWDKARGQQWGCVFSS
ncbi:hypothetical protein COHA_005036 [Chlorella ohadii]|uniref:AMP-dependent synthetase/ligase domain-containing protein n=1 Tax=Chlorella ohadii TaxID=2649997 RepID=A0AAD5H548_9CHLO|nr:hypothetical protein COHA_005036 [Chlorella ohadii]